MRSRHRHRQQCGFTLIELITVIVILGLIASVGSRFVVTSLKSYRDIQSRQQLSQQTWNSMEQISRRIRNATISEVKVSDDKKCLFIQDDMYCAVRQRLIHSKADKQAGAESIMAEVETTSASFTDVVDAAQRLSAIHIRLRFKRYQYGLDIDRKVFIRNDPS